MVNKDFGRVSIKINKQWIVYGLRNLFGSIKKTELCLCIFTYELSIIIE